MPVAAVPAYLGKDFSHASPGMRFGMYLKIWTSRADQEREVRDFAGRRSPEARELKQVLDEKGMDAAMAHVAHGRNRKNFPRLWAKNDFASRKAWQTIIELAQDDRRAIAALNARQARLAALADSAFELPAVAQAPFVTGMGNEHPLENGFSFLWPYGIPYLPGSGVKGVLRQAVRELCSGVWGASPWQDAPGGQVTLHNRAVPLDAGDVLFGLESADGGQEHVRGVLTFWDVIPEIRGNRLMVEIMTPHQAHYYQKGEPPHDSGLPTPVSFLTVPPGSRFVFHVICDTPRLARIAPALLDEVEGRPRWQHLLEVAFAHAFDWLGFGAKTAVGYGAMQIDPSLARQREEEEQRRQAEAEQRRREAEAAAEAERRRRQFEALPEAEKAIQGLQRELERFPDTGPLNKDTFSALLAVIKPWQDKAADWNEDDRKRLADYLESVFDRLGWAASGLKKDKRQKQEKKRRAMLDKLRGKAGT